MPDPPKHARKRRDLAQVPAQHQRPSPGRSICWPGSETEIALKRMAGPPVAVRLPKQGISLHLSIYSVARRLLPGMVSGLVKSLRNLCLRAGDLSLKKVNLSLGDRTLNVITNQIFRATT